ncbi:MAG TPA: diacylglycerol kinase family protein [Candidatus Saccharimonadales bacterium]|nr:diacylglycerol kinase family protein [Candidatus Saccharimonadales bacterium]
MNGVISVLRSERNARIHVVIALLTLLLGLILNISNAEMAAIFFAILLVFLAELLNTAIEETLNLVDGKENPKVRLIKDMTAGAVLVAACGAIVIGIAIFWPYILGLVWQG